MHQWNSQFISHKTQLISGFPILCFIITVEDFLHLCLFTSLFTQKYTYIIQTKVHTGVILGNEEKELWKVRQSEICGGIRILMRKG
jgi:hypothetical protein